MEGAMDFSHLTLLEIQTVCKDGKLSKRWQPNLFPWLLPPLWKCTGTQTTAMTSRAYSHRHIHTVQLGLNLKVCL